MKNITFDALPELVGLILQKIEGLENRILQTPSSVNASSAQNGTAWLDLEELCSYLPDKPSKSTVYSWVGKGYIPYHKKENGKKLYFLHSEIDAWLASGRKKTHSEIEAEAIANISTGRRAR